MYYVVVGVDLQASQPLCDVQTSAQALGSYLSSTTYIMYFGDAMAHSALFKTTSYPGIVIKCLARLL